MISKIDVSVKVLALIKVGTQLDMDAVSRQRDSVFVFGRGGNACTANFGQYLLELQGFFQPFHPPPPGGDILNP